MEVSTIIVKQKDLGCGATKVHIIEQDLETNDSQTRLFWKTLGGKADVAGNALHCSFLFVCGSCFIYSILSCSWGAVGRGGETPIYGLHKEGKFTSRAKVHIKSAG